MERRVATYDEGAVFYFGSDGDRPLIMLHGLCGSGEFFDAAYADPALAGRSLIAIDLPGFGATPDVDNPNLSVMADAVRAVLDRESPEHKPWLLAHGISACVAAQVLDDCAGVILLEGTLLKAHLDLCADFVAMEEDAFTKSFADMQKSAGRIIADACAITDSARLEHYGEAYRQCARNTVRSIAQAVCADAENGVAINAFRSTDLPVVVLCGGNSDYAAAIDDVRATLPNARISAISDARKYPMFDNPTATYAAVAEITN